MNNQEKFSQILAILSKEYPEATCILNYSNPMELLVATILAAQCTDERVNKVTVNLFQKYKSVQDYAEADINELIGMIHSTGFFNNKAKSIINTAKAILQEYQGIVPENMEDLTRLPGVGRKTANVILGECFHKPAIIVDTHFKRLMNRIGLSSSNNPDKIEMDIIAISSERERTRFSHCITFHGRKVCNAKKPDCAVCSIARFCNLYLKAV